MAAPDYSGVVDNLPPPNGQPEGVTTAMLVADANAVVSYDFGASTPLNDCYEIEVGAGILSTTNPVFIFLADTLPANGSLATVQPVAKGPVLEINTPGAGLANTVLQKVSVRVPAGISARYLVAAAGAAIGVSTFIPIMLKRRTAQATLVTADTNLVAMT